MTQKLFDRLLLGLSVFCLLTIFQIKFFQLPFNWFNLCDSNIEKTNDIVENFAIGIIASYIFYVINIQILNYFRHKKSRLLIDNYLVDIASQMKIGQLYLQTNYFKNHDFRSLNENNFRNITTLSNALINFSYHQVNTLGINQANSANSLTEIDLFDLEADLVKKNILTIFSFPFISTVDYELISLLHKIQTSFFYIGVNEIKNGSIYLNFNKHLFERYSNFKELERYVTPRQITI